MTAAGETIELTIILVVSWVRSRARRCLDALLAQQTSAVEILVVDVAPEGSLAFPDPVPDSVRVLRLPPDTTFGAARAAAVRAARGRAVAFLEEHVVPLAGFVDAVIAAHRQPHAGICGEIDNLNPGIGCSDVVGLMTYGPFYSPQRPRETAMIAGHNSSYKRDVLIALGADLDHLLAAADLVLMTRLRRHGHALWVDPRIRISHANVTSTADACRGYFLHHRAYGPLRAREERWPWWRRVVYIVAAPLIPIYFIVRFRRLLRRQRPDLVPMFDRGLPTAFGAQLAGACGQAAGLLVGIGQAEAGFTRHELTDRRREDLL